MTIVEPNPTVVESLNEFATAFSVTPDEILSILSDSTIEGIVKDVNEMRQKKGQKTIQDPETIDREVLIEYVSYDRGLRESIELILGERDTIYLLDHHLSGTNVFPIDENELSTDSPPSNTDLI